MSSAVLHPAKGATALGPDSAGGASVHGHRHVLGNALRAVKVFGRAAFSVAVLGEYGEDATPADHRTGHRTDQRTDHRTDDRTGRRAHRHA
ncbi:hypothetical protein [Streptomyces lydicus]|uniref:Uncharacterized protein n=1 Tax=Streptomyces lydicus TaxID=47763 RepID=A0A1D7VU67_9ACTN|nr:hypothetical protein SL103_32170 [Streptomyces lydicus]